MTIKSKSQQITSFHNDEKIKQKYLDRVKLHYKQDEIIKGAYWEDGKGCAVGCIVETSDFPHQQMLQEIGTPLWLNHLVDTLFENLPNEHAKEFPLRFIEAVPVGITEKQFTILKHRLSKYLITDICRNTDHEAVRDAIQQVIQYHDDMIHDRFESESAAESARSAAWSAALSATWSTTRSAADSVESAALSAALSAAWSTAWSAADSVESAAWSARSAADSVESAAWSAAESAESAALSVALSTAESAESAAFIEESDTLIRMLRELKKE